MLGENIRNKRKAMGLSQEELALKLNVVRQTVSKWEQGISVPDSELLIELSHALDTPVNELLGETAEPVEADTVQALSEKLELVNLQLARKTERSRRFWRAFSIGLGIAAILLLIGGLVLYFAVFHSILSPIPDSSLGAIGGADGPTQIYITSSPSFSPLGFLICGFLLLLAAVIGFFLTRKK